jgi:excisionase family DNA binding protein
MTPATADPREALASEGFADLDEAQDYLSMSRSSIYKLMDSGELQYAKFGKARRIARRSLRDYARRCLVGGGPAGAA